jgi:glutathione S-transferase
MAYPVLWHFPVSHFNEKVRWALDFKRIPHLRKALFLDYMPRALWATGRPTLPILIVDGRAIGDSTRILEALEQSNPDPPLYPRDETLRRRAVALEDFFDEELGHQLRAAMLGPMFVSDHDGVMRSLSLGMNLSERTSRVMRAIFPAFSAFYRFRHKINATTVEQGPAKIRAALDRISAELAPSGYLVGDRFSVADLCAAALLSPLVIPKQFQYPIPDPLPRSLVEMRETFSTHPAFLWVEEMYRRHRGTSAEVQPDVR